LTPGESWHSAVDMQDATVTLEPALCPCCGVPPQRLVRRSRSWLDGVPGVFDVRACRACGLWITSPRPSEEDLRRVYPAGYHRSRITEQQAERPRLMHGSLLDVGCGVGDGLVLARADGWECTGIEQSEEAAAIARARGLHVITGDATDDVYPEQRFDRVRCWHTIEHVSDPGLLLRRLGNAVKPNGSISLVLPNRGGLTSAVFRRYWYHLDVPRHLHHFRPNDVRVLAAANGLSVESVRHAASPSGLLGSLDIVLGRLARRDPRLRSRNRLRSTVRALTWPIARLHLADVVDYELVLGSSARKLAPDQGRLARSTPSATAASGPSGDGSLPGAPT
jgi:SAM-dependent methyltransferase